MLAAAASTKSKKPSSRKALPRAHAPLLVLLRSCIALRRSRTEQSGRRRRRRWTTYLDSLSLRRLNGVAGHGLREEREPTAPKTHNQTTLYAATIERPRTNSSLSLSLSHLRVCSCPRTLLPMQGGWGLFCRWGTGRIKALRVMTHACCNFFLRKHAAYSACLLYTETVPTDSNKSFVHSHATSFWPTDRHHSPRYYISLSLKRMGHFFLTLSAQ